MRFEGIDCTELSRYFGIIGEDFIEHLINEDEFDSIFKNCADY